MNLGKYLFLGLTFMMPVIGKDTEISKYPIPSRPAPSISAKLGENIQRTMRLLATSTFEHHNHVRILFYGQSITKQEWSGMVADDLRRRFPNADIEIKNLAIGGFASQLLIKPAEHDLYPFYPDLVIFHVYGSNGEYEQIIKSIRSRTAAEVLMQKDHVTQWPPAHIDEKLDKGAWWDDKMNNHFLPEIAAKYGCGLADIRSEWLTYLKEYHLEPKDLLRDGVHLNDYGNFVMATLIGHNLVYRPDLPNQDQNLVHTLRVGDRINWDEGRIKMEFEGNRIDIIPAATGGAAKILIDGKEPSTIPELYSISRPNDIPGKDWPWDSGSLTRIDHNTPLLEEEWTAKITNIDTTGTQLAFEVSGSKTGPDGTGTNLAKFISNSGRVVIQPDYWFITGLQNRVLIKKGDEIKWHVVPHFKDRYIGPAEIDPSRETAIPIAQGLSNGKHTLEMIGDLNNMPALRSIRIYCPPVKE